MQLLQVHEPRQGVGRYPGDPVVPERQDPELSQEPELRPYRRQVVVRQVQPLQGGQGEEGLGDRLVAELPIKS